MALLSAAASLVTASNAGAARVVERIALPDDEVTLRARPSGGPDLVRTVLAHRRIGFARTPWSGRASALGAPRRSTELQRSNDGYSLGFTRSGPLAAFGVVQKGGRHRLALTTFDLAGASLGTQYVSTGGLAAREATVVTGGGATAVGFDVRAVGREDQTVRMLTFRPAGSRRFGSAQPVDAPADFGRVLYSVAIGPSGDGAILATPNGGGSPSRVRRIGPAGVLGPWLPIAAPLSDDAKGVVGIAADGTIVVGLVAGNLSGDPVRPTAVLATTVPRGSNVLTPVQVLSRGGSRGLTVLENLAIAVGPSGDTVLAAVTHTPGDRLQFFAGPAGRLAPAGDAPVDVAEFGDTRITLAVDGRGRATALWAGSGVGDRATPLFTASRPVDGPFTAPIVVERPGPGLQTGPYFSPAIALSAGRATTIVSSSSGKGRSKTSLLVLAP